MEIKQEEYNRCLTCMGEFNIMNPFTYGNMKKAVEGTRAGDENMEYSDTPAGKIGEAANERNRMIQQLLQGY